MKIINVRIELKQGLPNFSSRTTEVSAAADEGESLDVVRTVQLLADKVRQGWAEKSAEPPAPLKLEAPIEPKVEATKVEPAPENLVIKAGVKRQRISNPLEED